MTWGGGRVPARQVRGGGVETALNYTECTVKRGNIEHRG
jgi:hypothetical protein